MKRASIFLLAAGVLLNALSSVDAAPDPLRLSPDLVNVLRSGDARAIRDSFQPGLLLRARDAHGNTPLLLAAVYAEASVLKLLLDQGADLHAANNAGETALIRSASNAQKVRLLLERGANPNVKSQLGNTPLILAARAARSHPTVALLLQRGADAKATNAFGATALMAAAAGGDLDSARLLLRHGADINAQTTPDEMGFLLGGGRTALGWAAFRGNLEMLKLLIDAGADVNSVGMFGTALSQAAWADHTKAAKLLLAHGARVDLAGPRDGFATLHWAASTEHRDPALVKLLLDHGADPNAGGGEPVEAFLGALQTPAMLAERRRNASIQEALAAAGATNRPARIITEKVPPQRTLPEHLAALTLREAAQRAIAPLQITSLASKKAFVRHESQQDCTSCHSQHLPMAVLGFAGRFQIPIDLEAEQELIQIVRAGDFKSPDPDWQPLFHPDPAHTKGYALFACGSQDLPAGEDTDAWVHHLAAIQGKDGQWHNNLPRPPMQTGDISATALAIYGLKRYGLPGRQTEFAQRIDRAREWLRNAKPETHEDRAYQLLGLAWSGESAENLQDLAKALRDEQRPDGGWGQLQELPSDAYATGQAVFALRLAAAWPSSHPAIDAGLRFLLKTQLDDGTWHVRRRAFPFQPTMNSGFPHGRDSWISTAGTSWAVIALSFKNESESAQARVFTD